MGVDEFCNALKKKRPELVEALRTNLSINKEVKNG
jgi:hypothetical protein